MLQRKQQTNVKEALDLFMRTQMAFAQCEANGIKIDRPFLEQSIISTKERLEQLKSFIFNDTEVGRRWHEIYGEQAVFTARQQLADVLFKNKKNPHPRNMGFEAREFTNKGGIVIAESSLEKIPEIQDFTKAYVLYMALSKMLTTNLQGIKSCLDCNDFIHPSFSLFSVISYRTASSGPNFQNIPHHNPELESVVRRCFIPRSLDRHLCELDYSGAEVRINASINHDPTLVGSVTKGVDFHKAIAAKSYMLEESQVTKSIRQSVKGTYTFAAFYGSYWGAIAQGLWENIIYGGLTLEDGTTLRDHLKSKGITELGDIEDPKPGTYADYIKQVDQWFWGDMFQVYGQWKNKVWREYQRTGYVDLPSGFRCAGVFSRNMVTNFSAQGGASHCLLWSFCKLNDTIKELGLQTKICGQIHDSILIDVPHDELDDVLRLANDIMTVQLRQKFPWIAVPMEIEADVSPMGKSWYEKEEYPIPS